MEFIGDFAVSPKVAPDLFGGVHPKQLLGMAGLTFGVVMMVSDTCFGIPGPVKGLAASDVCLKEYAINRYQVVTIYSVVAPGAVNSASNASAPYGAIPQNNPGFSTVVFNVIDTTHADGSAYVVLVVFRQANAPAKGIGRSIISLEPLDFLSFALGAPYFQIATDLVTTDLSSH